MVKSSGGQQSNTVNTPWTPYQPYLQDFFGQAKQAYQSGGPQYAPFSTVAPFSPQQQQAFGMAEQRAQGSPLEGAAQGYLQGSLQGQYSPGVGAMNTSLGTLGQLQAGGSNPFLDQTFNQASQRFGQQFQEQTAPAIQAMFGGAGRSNSGLQAQVLGNAHRELGDQQSRLATSIYGGAYENDQQRRLQAAQSMGDLYQGGQAERARSASMVPGMSALDWGNIAGLHGVGAQVQGQGQNLINDQLARFNFYQNAPYQNLTNYQNWLNLGMGQGSNSSIGAGSDGSRFSNALGGAMSGGAIGGPWGAAIGGIAGLFG